MRRVLPLIAVSLLAPVAAGCSGSSGGVAPAGGQPSTTAGNYFPLGNRATWQGRRPGGALFSSTGPLASSSSLGTQCSGALGNFGDFSVSTGQLIIPTVDIVRNPAFGTPVISKNADGDVFVVGTFAGVETCIAPYPIAKARMARGATWTFVDGVGTTRTAVVLEDHVTASFTAQALNGPGPTTTYTADVAEVSYGPDQTIFWAAGFGPVDVLNTFTNAGSPVQFEPELTAFGWTVNPLSR